jgi:hypothetical protein
LLRASAFLALFAFVTAAAVAACGADSPTAPGEGAIATILVSGETFRVLLTTDEQIAAAKAAQAGGRANIPHGRIVAGTQVNVGYSWHLEDVRFVEVTIELCDGRPSMVEAAGGPAFADGTFCPWGAKVVSVEQRAASGREP